MFICSLYPEKAGGGQRPPPGSLRSLPQPCKSIRAKQTLQIRWVTFDVPRDSGLGGASPRSRREAPGGCLFLGFCVFQKRKMPKQSYKTRGLYILNVYME